MRWLKALPMVALLALAACSRPPVPSAPDLPTPVVPGPALGHVELPRDTGNWDASESDPAATAKAFVLGADLFCDCDDVTAVSVPGKTANHAVVTVNLTGLKDDSVKSTEYKIEVERSGAKWKVIAATYSVECRRGIDDNSGLCM